LTGHVCPNCGSSVECDKRLLGTGRQKPLHRYGPNHEAVHKILAWPERWWTVRQIQAQLMNESRPHIGKRDAWNYVAVQSVVSDLVGWGYANMARVPKSREWKYSFVRPRTA
jgi:hypothetical protein